MEATEDTHTTASAIARRLPPTTWAVVGASLLAPLGIAAVFGTAASHAAWLPALAAPFIAAFHRGWRGAAAATGLGGLALLAIRAPWPALAALAVAGAGSALLTHAFRRLLDASEQRSLTDAGTGLPNRRHGMIHLKRAFAAANRGIPLSVVMFDLDRFKRINDLYGHRSGDEVLRVFARILEQHTRAMNLSVRLGGEEFLAILDGEHADGATIMAERTIAALREYKFPWGRVTVSAGIAEYEPAMASHEVLVAAADQALYRAKANGRDQVVVMEAQGPETDPSILEKGPRPAAPADAGYGELILVVDDDRTVLETFARVLAKHGYRPLQADNPLQALQVANSLDTPLDLVVSDVMMPEMSGFRLVEILLERQPELRALYISGYARDDVRWSGVPGAVKAFVSKPLGADDLVDHVRSLLDAKPAGRKTRDAENTPLRAVNQ